MELQFRTRYSKRRTSPLRSPLADRFSTVIVTKNAWESINACYNSNLNIFWPNSSKFKPIIALIILAINFIIFPDVFKTTLDSGESQRLAKKQRINWLLIHDSKQLTKKMLLDLLVRISSPKRLFLDSLIRNNFSKILFLDSFFETETAKVNHLFRINCFFANLWC